MEPELQFAVSLPSRDLGLLLANLTSIREGAEESLHEPGMVELARSELEMVRRLRSQIEKAVGAGYAADLEERAQGIYGDVPDALGFSREDEEDPNMQP